MKTDNDKLKTYLDELQHFIEVLERVGSTCRTLTVLHESESNKLFRSICCAHIELTQRELITLRSIYGGA